MEIKFRQYYVANDLFKAKVSYSMDARIDKRKCVTIYARDWCRNLRHVFQDLDAPGVVLNQIVVGCQNPQNSLLNFNRRQEKIERPYLRFADVRNRHTCPNTFDVTSERVMADNVSDVWCE